MSRGGAIGVFVALLAALCLLLPATSAAAHHHHGRRGSGPTCPGHPRKHPPCKHPKPVLPTVTPGPVNLTPAESADVAGVDRLREAAGVEVLQTSPLLQQIAEKRAHVMAASESGYAGETVYAETVEEGICAHHAHEVSGIGENLDEAGSPPGQGNGGELEAKIWEGQTDPEFNVIGDAIVEAGGTVYAVEDFAHSC